MKTKTKILAVVEIVIVLCSVFLVALPAIAAEQTTQKASATANTITTSSEDDYVLDIYGNANEDDTIDMRDLTYVKLIFFGKKPETELSDAKYDGKINPLDFIQIKLIIVGKEKEITIVDRADRIVTVKKPVKRIIPMQDSPAEAIRILVAENKVVGVSSGIAGESVLLPVMSKLPTVGSFRNPDCEAILALKPDIVIGYGTSIEELAEKLEPYITVIILDVNRPEALIEDVMKLGYILDKKNEAYEFADFYKSYTDKLKEYADGILEDDKPQVYLASATSYKAIGPTHRLGQMCVIAGGNNIAADLPGSTSVVDPEWVLEQNPDIIVMYVRSGVPSGYGVDDITGMKTKRQEIMNCPGWEKITAIESENVYLIASDISTGPQEFVGITYLAKWFHPEHFKDLNPQAIQQEYLTRFERIDYNVYEHGVFVYPPLED